MSSSSASTTTQAVRDTSLGFDDDEIQLLRRAQISAAGTAGSSSSRAASRASSQGLLLLDGSSLAALTRHFDQLMRQISERLEYLIEQSQTVAAQQYDRAGNAIDMADAELERLRRIDAQIDELEEDFERVGRVKDVVKTYKARVEELERSVEQSSSRRDRGEGGHRHRRHDEGRERRHRR